MCTRRSTEKANDAFEDVLRMLKRDGLKGFSDVPLVLDDTKSDSIPQWYYFPNVAWAVSSSDCLRSIQSCSQLCDKLKIQLLFLNWDKPATQSNCMLLVSWLVSHT